MSISENNESLVTAVVPVKTTAALTTYAESAPSVESSKTTSDDKLDVISNPYESQDLKKVLERSYLVATVNFTHTSGAGTALLAVQFPGALLAIENIADKLTQFEYLKSDVEVEVRVNATQFHIGSLNISWASHATNTTNAISTPSARMNKNSTPMSLSAINSVKVRIPRTGPLLWDLAHPDSGTAGPNIGTLFVDVIDPITTLSGTDASDLLVSVFARFVNPRVAGYGVTDLLAPDVKRKARRLAMQAVKSGINEKKSREEGIKKSEKGLISGIAEAAGSFAPILAATPFAEFAPIAGLAGQFAPFLASLGLCKPNDVSSVTQVVNKPAADVTHAHGLSMAVKMTDHPDSSLADTDVSELKRHTFKELISKPCHILKSAIDSSTLPDITFLHFPVHPGLCKWDGVSNYYPTYLAYLSQLFGKWRGGLKFTIKFVTSQFTTARVRILHLPNANLPTSIEAFAGDVPNAVVDIRGNTDYSFTLPYLSAFPYLPVGGYMGPQQSTGFAQAFPHPSTWLSISLVSPVNIPDATGNSIIHYHVYVSAAEDFQFGEFIGLNYRKNGYIAPPLLRAKKVVEPKEKKTEKKSIELLFKKAFDPLIPAVGSRETALVLPETVSGVEEVLKKPRICLVTNSGTQLNGYMSLDQFGNPGTVLHLLLLFQYYRGAIRYKIVPATDRTATLQWFDFGYSVYRDGDHELVTLTAPCTDIEVPWNEVTYLRNLGSFDCPQDIIVSNSNAIQTEELSGNTIYFSVGEDFMLGGVLPPLPFDATASTELEKTDLSESVSSRNFTTLLEGE